MMNLRKEYAKIYDKYIDKIYRFVFLKVNSQEIAEDLCSETFLRCWEKFKENPKSIDNPQAFLYQIARNIVIDHYRQKGRTQTVPIDCVPIADSGLSLEERAQNNSDLFQVRQAIAKLDEPHQEVVIWHYLDDLSIPEIAKMTNKTEGNIRVMLCRALKSLKSEIFREGERGEA